MSTCRPAVASCLILLLLLAAMGGSVAAAPVIGPLGGGAHGVALVPEGGGQAALVVQVLATSKPLGDVKPAALPGDLAARVKDTPQGAYVRDEWDKGALLSDNWSARWTGTLKVDQEGEYTFYATDRKSVV